MCNEVGTYGAANMISQTFTVMLEYKCSHVEQGMAEQDLDMAGLLPA